MLDENRFKTIEWRPFPETEPEDPDWLKTSRYLVTMSSKFPFVTVAEWRHYKDRKGNEGNRWIYEDRVNFPWEVIAWADLPEPYKYKEEN